MEDSQKILKRSWKVIGHCLSNTLDPSQNGLIVVVELKHLFQGSMTLEEFHTRARILMKEAEFPTNAMKQWMLTDTVITEITDDKI